MEILISMRYYLQLPEEHHTMHRSPGGRNARLTIFLKLKGRERTSDNPEFGTCVKLSRGCRPGLSVLTSLMVSVDVKQYWTVLWHWSQFVRNMSTDIRGHEALLHQRQSDQIYYSSVSELAQQWNCFQGNVGETFERRLERIILWASLISKHIDVIFELNIHLSWKAILILTLLPNHLLLI